LFQDAREKVDTLKNDVCGLTHHLHHRGGTQEQKAARRQLARKSLATVGTLAPAVVMGMAAVTPDQAIQNLTAWDLQLIHVMAIHNVTHVVAIPSTVGAAAVGVAVMAPIALFVVQVVRIPVLILVQLIKAPVYVLQALGAAIRSRQRVPQRAPERVPVNRRR
jgi:hypothetical protein